MVKKKQIIKSVKLDKFVHGGQVIGTLSSGEKILVWNGLPDEVADIEVIKKKGSYYEGLAINIIETSKDRINPREPSSYLSTSPWQILDFDAEKGAKQAILIETLEREGLTSLAFRPFLNDIQEFNYRNKQEFGFWGDDTGLNLAHYMRGTHNKVKINGSDLAKQEINLAARDLRDELNRLNVWGGKLKTLVVRSSRQKEVVSALFIKEDIKELADFKLPKTLKGLDIYLSDPRSPAAVVTKNLYSFGDINLVDRVMGANITYDVMSFFQINLPMFEMTLEDIRRISEGLPVIDMYSGVGTIGLSLENTQAIVETDTNNINKALVNAKKSSVKVIHASSEKALEYIPKDGALVLDPPRAGLHRKVIEGIRQAKPEKVIYLSCNPSTQARDIKLLADIYKVDFIQGYNYFPRTPHIESLVSLTKVD